MFIVNIASMAQEQVFSIGTNGDIVTKTKFIEELYSGNYNNVTLYASRADGYVATRLMYRLICTSC